MIININKPVMSVSPVMFVFLLLLSLLSILLVSLELHVCVEEDQHEGQSQVEDQPNIDHLDVSCWRQIFTNL